MSSTSGSFNILGSAKLNTSDGKNPAASASKPSVTGSDQHATGSTTSDDHHKQCSRAHDELETKLRDQELNGRSRGCLFAHRGKSVDEAPILRKVSVALDYYCSKCPRHLEIDGAKENIYLGPTEA
ncbi:MAG: hypothetical protein Q9171_005608 [Xanthocarpia ochracea]